MEVLAAGTWTPVSPSFLFNAREVSALVVEFTRAPTVRAVSYQVVAVADSQE
jgi:hypothetical protein